MTETIILGIVIVVFILFSQSAVNNEKIKKQLLDRIKQQFKMKIYKNKEK